MDKIQKDINDALDSTRRLNLVKIIFVAPFFFIDDYVWDIFTDKPISNG